MAVRVTADASAPKRSANAPTETAYTFGCWAYLNSATPARFWGPLGLYAGTDGAPTGNTQFHQISSLASGSASLVLGYDDGAVGQAIALGTARAGFWHFFAMTCNAVAAGGLKAYMRQAHERTFSKAVNSNSARVFTPARFEYGRDGFTGDFIDGAAQHCFAFDRALDEAELMKLSIALLAEKPFPDRSNLNVYYRFRGADDIQDRSGNARPATFTVGANAQGLRVWTPKRRVIASGSGGTHNIAVGLASSANTAFAIARKKQKTMGLPTSANTAFAITRNKRKTTGLASSGSTAFAIAHTKRRTLGLPTSANTAFIARPQRLKALGLATSANLALALAHAKRKVLGLPSSANTALPMTHTGGAGGGSTGGGIAAWIENMRRRIFSD